MNHSLRLLLFFAISTSATAGCFPVKWEQLIAPEMQGRVTRDGQPLTDVAVHIGGSDDKGSCWGEPVARSGADGSFAAPKQVKQHKWIGFGDYFGANSLCFSPGDGSGVSSWRFTKQVTPKSLTFRCQLAATGSKLATVTDAGAVGCVVDAKRDGP